MESDHEERSNFFGNVLPTYQIASERVVDELIARACAQRLCTKLKSHRACDEHSSTTKHMWFSLVIQRRRVDVHRACAIKRARGVRLSTDKGSD